MEENALNEHRIFRLKLERQITHSWKGFHVDVFIVHDFLIERPCFSPL